MSDAKRTMVERILERHGRTFCEEMGVDVAQNSASALFRLLVFALLSSARISYRVAMDASMALSSHGWNTPEEMADSTWRQRTDVLNASGYARYDESTSRMLGETCDMLLEEYGGDLRELRRKAGEAPQQERRLLKKLKGLGDVGIDIFFREAQVAWEELRPFADERTMETARRLELAQNVTELQELVAAGDFPRLVAALVRIQLEKDYDALLNEQNER